MFWDNALIWIVLTAASFVIWKKYKDPFFRWLFWVSVILAGASTWQYLIENVFQVSEAIQMGSLVAVEILRLVFIAMFILVIIRLFRSKSR